MFYTPYTPEAHHSPMPYKPDSKLNVSEGP